MDQRQRRIYRTVLLALLGLTVLLAAFLWYIRMQVSVPDEILIFEDQEEHLSLSLPFTEMKLTGDEVESAEVSVDQSQKVGSDLKFSVAKPVSFLAKRSGTLSAEVRAFGWLHCKNVKIDIRKETRVMPVGRAVGLYIHADGVMVLGTGNVDGKYTSPAYERLQTGDYISEVNGKEVRTIRDVIRCIQENGEKKLVLSVTRGVNHIKVKLSPIQVTDGSYQIGAWLREDTEGIGTLTFVTQDNQFAALGHGITDADTELLIRLQNGGLYPATIDHIEKGTDGAPGQLVGSVQLGGENRLGTISDNTALGITGNVTAPQYCYQSNKAYPIGRKQDVRRGEAKILCQLSDKVEEYTIEIEKIQVTSEDNKGMEIKVTDPRLLEKTGGIVQGMSGAPIIQDGKCIGAVTHVFVKDVTRGYATFIENMI